MVVSLVIAGVLSFLFPTGFANEIASGVAYHLVKLCPFATARARTWAFHVVWIGAVHHPFAPSSSWSGREAMRLASTTNW
jgi:hypothetical protein